MTWGYCAGMMWWYAPRLCSVIPAKAGIQTFTTIDSRLRGNDKRVCRLQRLRGNDVGVLRGNDVGVLRGNDVGVRRE